MYSLYEYLTDRYLTHLLVCLIFIVTLFVLLSLSASVIEQVLCLSEIYDKYYEAVCKGQEEMARRGELFLDQRVSAANTVTAGDTVSHNGDRPQEKSGEYQLRLLASSA